MEETLLLAYNVDETAGLLTCNIFVSKRIRKERFVKSWLG